MVIIIIILNNKIIYNCSPVNLPTPSSLRLRRIGGSPDNSPRAEWSPTTRCMLLYDRENTETAEHAARLPARKRLQRSSAFIGQSRSGWTPRRTDSAIRGLPTAGEEKSKKGGGLLPMAPNCLLIQLLTSIKLSSLGTVQLPLCCFFFILVQWTWRRAPRRREGNTHGVREFRTRVDIKFIWRASHWTPQPHGSSTRDTEAILVVTSDDQSELSPVFMSTKRQLVSGVQRRAWHVFWTIPSWVYTRTVQACYLFQILLI